MTTPPCHHRGSPGPSGLVACSSPWVKVPAKGVELSFCARCPYAGRSDEGAPPQRPSQSVPESHECPHRGAVLRQHEATLCGVRGQFFDVHACDRYGECTIRRICYKQPVRTCTACIIAGENQEPIP